MKNTPKKPTSSQKPYVKPITVRLDTQEERDAFFKYSQQQSRSMDKQAGVLIKRELIEAGYIEPEFTHTSTQ